MKPPSLRLNELRALLDPQKALRRILMASIRATGAKSGSFMLINPNTGTLDIEASYGLTKRAVKTKLKLGQGITGWVASTGKPWRIDDVRTEPKYVSINPSVRSELAAPIEIKGHVIGIINLDHTEVAAFTEEHLSLLTRLGAEAAEWLTHVWEIDQLRVKGQQLASLLDMGHMIISEADLDKALPKITQQANRLMKTKLCSLLLVNDETGELFLRASHGAGNHYRKKPNVPLADSLLGVVFTRRKSLAVLDVRDHQRYRHLEVARKEGLASLLAVPLIFNETPLGVLAVYTEQLHRFSNDEIKLLKTLADLSAVAIEKGRVLAHVMDIEEKIRASERLSALGLLAAEIAHEIRNPLTVLQMLFHSLVESLPAKPDIQRDAQIMGAKMKQMNRILDRVLTFARSSEPAKEFIEADALLDDISLLVRHKLSQQKVEIRQTVAPAMPPLHADRAQIEQALLNLILNGSDAMPDGGILRLGAQTETLGGVRYAVLSVRDNGQGMSQRQIEKIFAPFLTFKEGGTGIGLAIVRKIMENHRGKIQVESKPGKGTQFRLLLPFD